jgi:hypothetical protein
MLKIILAIPAKGTTIGPQLDTLDIPWHGESSGELGSVMI